MNLEDRLSALEAEVRALKQQLEGKTSRPRPAPEPLPAVHRDDTPPVIERQTSAEVRLGSYWVTRVGAILVLLAAIFLAAYLSVYSNPTIRVSELAAAALATLAVAYWQQHRNNLRFALVLHSLGDALVFFTAFAAYAFDATRVLDGVVMAIVAQTVAGLFVCAHALQRRSEGSATFSLVLLAWVAGFSLTYQHSGTTLGYVVAITLTAVALRARWSWNWPLLFAAVAGPGLSAWLAFEFDGLRTPLEITWAILPLLIALPSALGAAVVTRRDRAVVLTGSGAVLLAALYARYAPEVVYAHQLIVQAAVSLGVAALYRARSGPADSIRPCLSWQHAFLAAWAGALYLGVRFPAEAYTGLAILGLGCGTAAALRRQTRWINGAAYLGFGALALLWRWKLPDAEVVWGSRWYWAGLVELTVSAGMFALVLAPERRAQQLTVASLAAATSLGVFILPVMDSPSGLLTLIAIATVAGALAPRAPSLFAWAGVALVLAHLEAFRPVPRFEAATWWGLLLLTLLDGMILTLRPRPTVEGPSTTFLVIGMLGSLYYGFAEAHLSCSPTFIWVPLAAGTFILGFWRHNARYRVAALAAFGACLIRLFARDLNTSATRIAASFLLGVILLGIGYLYSRLNRSTLSDSKPPSPPEHSVRPSPSPPA